MTRSFHLNTRSFYRNNQDINIFDVPEEKAASVNKCLEATCVNLNLNVAEIWQFVPITGVSHPHGSDEMGGESISDDTEAPICLHVYSRFDDLDRHKAKVVIVGSRRDGKNDSSNIHKISPQLCTMAYSRKSPNSPLWYFSSKPKFDNEIENPLYGHDYYKVVVAIPISAKYGGTLFRYCVVFFSINAVRRCEDIELFLEHMSEACILALTSDIHTNMDEWENLETVTPIDSIDSEVVDDFKSMELPLVCLNMDWGSLDDIEHLVDGSKFTTFTAKYKSRNVVVKVVRKDSRNMSLAINNLESELLLLLRCDHPNIVRLLGAGTFPERFLVLEWADSGTLKQWSDAGYPLCESEGDCKFTINNKPFLAMKHVLRFGRQLADAMHYLNSGAVSDKTVIHGDLRPSNIGFCKKEGMCDLKLLDMGLAREVTPKEVNTNKDIIGTSTTYGLVTEEGSMNKRPVFSVFMAAEVAEMRVFNEKADIFSFAMVVWCIMTYKQPYPEMDRGHFYGEVVRGNTRPVISPDTPEELKALLLSCWDEDPTQRPSFGEIITILQNIESQYADSTVTKP